MADQMYFHGIEMAYLKKQYPVLSARHARSGLSEAQQADRRHLVEQFGFEPVHLLMSGDDYPIEECLKACARFGRVILGFDHLPMPHWHLSRHEIGVPALAMHRAVKIWMIGLDEDDQQWLDDHFPETERVLLKLAPQRQS